MKGKIISFLIMLIILSGCSGTPVTNSSSINSFIVNRNQKIAVVPAKFGSDNDLRLPDAVETQLVNLGLDVIDRSALSQMVYEKGFDFTEIINGQEYFKIGKIVDVNLIIIINAKYGTAGVADATMKIVDITNGKIAFSTNYHQPTPNNSRYMYFQNIMQTAQELCKQITVR